MGGLFADAVDVHHAPGAEVLDLSGQLRTASVDVRTAVGGLSGQAHQLAAALGAVCDECHRLAAGLTPGKLHPHDLGNDFAAFLHIEPVVGVDVELVHDVGVMQGCTLHDCAA